MATRVLAGEVTRKESRTQTTIWSDREGFLLLSCRAQRMYWLLYSQSTISLCGVLALTVKRWANLASDESEETVTEALTELEKGDYIAVDWDSEEVFVRTFARHDRVNNSPKTWPAAWDQLGNVLSPALRKAAEHALYELGEPPAGYPIQEAARSPDTLSREPERFPDTQRGGAQGPRPPSSSSCPSTTPSSASAAANGKDVVLRTKQGPGNGKDQTRLLAHAQRLVNACTAQPAVIGPEAAAVVAWAAKYVSDELLSEAIGWAESRRDGDEPIRFPRGIAKVVVAKAADSNNHVPEFKL